MSGSSPNRVRREKGSRFIGGPTFGLMLTLALCIACAEDPRNTTPLPGLYIFSGEPNNAQDLKMVDDVVVTRNQMVSIAYVSAGSIGSNVVRVDVFHETEDSEVLLSSETYGVSPDWSTIYSFLPASFVHQPGNYRLQLIGDQGKVLSKREFRVE